MDFGNRGTGQGAHQRGNPLPLQLGVIKVIHATPRSTVAIGRGVLAIAPVGNCTSDQSLEKKMKIDREPITFCDDDLEGTIQSYDDTMFVTARISSFLVKKVMIDQGNGADVLYSDLFKGLGLKNQSLSKYDMTLVRFDGRVVIPEG
nr:hypothetical protein CFP56_17951 [Quercus suber]